MTMLWRRRVSSRLGWLAAGTAAVVLLGVGGLVVSRVLAAGDGSDVRLDDPPGAGGIAATDLLGEAATGLVDSATPSPDCAGSPAAVPPGADLVPLDVARVVDGCFTVTTEHLPPDLVDARKQEVAGDPTVVAASVTPVPTLLQADDRRGDQWSLDALGVPEGSSQLPWPAGAGVTVAVVDSGIDAGHPDLAGAVLARRHYPGEDESRPDPEGHGTHVAGIIGARAGNGGVVGVAPGVSLLDVPAPLHDSSGTLLNAGAGSIAAAIEWAVNQGADVINMSFGYYYDGLEFDPDDPESLANLAEFTAVAAAIRLADQEGIVLVAGAGNCGPASDCDHPDAPLVPARLNEVIAVGAVDEELGLAGFSSRYGLVDLVAPGDDIVSSVPGGHQARPGTSQAAPHVAAAAAIARSVNAARSATEIRSAMIESAVPLGDEPGFADQDPPVGAGAGRLDILGMLELVGPPGGDPAGQLYTFDQLVAVLPTAADLPEGYALLGSCADDPDYCINQGTSQAAAQMLATGDLGRSVSILATVMPDADQAAGRHQVLRGSDRGEAAGPVEDTEVAGWTGYRLLTSKARTDGTADDSRDWLQLVRGNALLEVQLDVPRDGADESERAARLETWITPVIAQLP